MQRQKLRSNPKKQFGHRNGRSSCAHSIGKFFLGYIVLFSSETSATGSPGNYLYIYILYTWITTWIHSCMFALELLFLEGSLYQLGMRLIQAILFFRYSKVCYHGFLTSDVCHRVVYKQFCNSSRCLHMFLVGQRAQGQIICQDLFVWRHHRKTWRKY